MNAGGTVSFLISWYAIGLVRLMSFCCCHCNCFLPFSGYNICFFFFWFTSLINVSWIVGSFKVFETCLHLRVFSKIFVRKFLLGEDAFQILKFPLAWVIQHIQFNWSSSVVTDNWLLASMNMFVNKEPYQALTQNNHKNEVWTMIIKCGV